MTEQPNANPNAKAGEWSGILSGFDRFGSASAMLFSRLYTGIGRRQAEAMRVQIAEQQTALDAERAMRLERDQRIEQLSATIEHLDEGVIVQDNDGKMLIINTAARALLGGTKHFWQSELGRMFSQYRELTTLTSEIQPLGDPARVEVNGRHIGVKLAALGDSHGARTGTMMMLRDVTAEVVSDRLKDQFVTAISHELRTPMAVIKGMSEVMIATPDDQKPNRRLMETLSRNVDVLDRMIVELLDISELSAGKFAIRREPVDLRDLLWGVIDGMQPDIRAGKLTAKVFTRKPEALTLTGDEQRLRWALGHLVQNSIRYTEPGGEIRLIAAPHDTSIVLMVEDTGVGISERDLPHIFDRFYRGEPRTPSGRLLDPRGLGQGLFIARAVTEAHGGYLTARSTPGQGSQFTLVLPAA